MVPPEQDSYYTRGHEAEEDVSEDEDEESDVSDGDSPVHTSSVSTVEEAGFEPEEEEENFLSAPSVDKSKDKNAASVSEVHSVPEGTEAEIQQALKLLSAYGRKVREAESKASLGGIQETCVVDAPGINPSFRSYAHVSFGCCGNGKRPESMFGLLCRLHRDGTSSSSTAGLDNDVCAHGGAA